MNLGFRKSEVQNGSWAKMKLLAGVHSVLSALGEDPFSCLFQLLAAACKPQLKAASLNLCFHLTSLTRTLLPSS